MTRLQAALLFAAASSALMYGFGVPVLRDVGVVACSAFLGLLVLTTARPHMTRRLDRWAAHRMLRRHLDTMADDWPHSVLPKSDDDLTVEAWLWEWAGAPDVAAVLRSTRDEGVPQ